MMWWVLPALAGPAQDRALIGQLDREVIALRQRVELLQEQLATCAVPGPPGPLYAELTQVLGGQAASVSRAGRNVVVSVPMDTLFSPDGRELREEAAPLVDLLAMALRAHPEARVDVRAYVDSGPVPAAWRKQLGSTWELAAWRAGLFVHALVTRFEVPAWMLTASTRADQEPVSAEPSADTRTLERRIVLFIDPGDPP